MRSAWLTTLILIVLGVSLVVNVVALSRIGDLRGELDEVQSQTVDISGLQARINENERKLSAFTEEQQLVTSVRWDVEDADDINCDEDVPVVVSWTFRELPADADVRFEVRPAGSDGWVQVQAERAGGTDFLARHQMRLDQNWEYRIIAHGKTGTVATDALPARQLEQFTDQRVIFEPGESISQDGQNWMRFALSPVAMQRTPCNEVVEAVLALYDGEQQLATVPLQPGYPGEHLPGGVEGEPDRSTGSNTTDGITFHSAPGIHDNARMQDDDRSWWTDWIEMSSSIEPELTIEFGDGTVRSIDRIGMN